MSKMGERQRLIRRRLRREREKYAALYGITFDESCAHFAEVQALYPRTYRERLTAELDAAERKRKRRPPHTPPEIRRTILERDNHTCQKCGATDGLHVHHKQRKGNGGSDDPDNLVTLCEACHTEEHQGEAVHHIMSKRLQTGQRQIEGAILLRGPAPFLWR